MKERHMLFRKIPAQVSAQNNPNNIAQAMQDSQGTVHQVPPGWWLVEEGPGKVALMSDEAFRPAFEEAKIFTPMDGFINTVGDLRDSDRRAVQRSMELEARIAALEGAQRAMADEVVRAWATLTSVMPGQEARIQALEAMARTISAALVPALNPPTDTALAAPAASVSAFGAKGPIWGNL